MKTMDAERETERANMKARLHGGSRIKTLRLDVRPGASAISQLAAAVAGRRGARSARISVASFVFPYFPGCPVYLYAGRKPLAPACLRPRR